MRMRKRGLDALGWVAEAAGCSGQDVGSYNCKAHLIYIYPTSQCYILFITRSILRLIGFRLMDGLARQERQDESITGH